MISTVECGQCDDRGRVSRKTKIMLPTGPDYALREETLEVFDVCWLCKGTRQVVVEVDGEAVGS